MSFRGGLGERRATTNSYTASREAAAVSRAVTVFDLRGTRANKDAIGYARRPRLIATWYTVFPYGRKMKEDIELRAPLVRKLISAKQIKIDRLDHMMDMTLLTLGP